MSSPYKQGWILTPYPEIFDKIMMMVGLSSLESLHRCRQVCSAWNAMIMQNIWENPSKRNIIIKSIEKKWGWVSPWGWEWDEEYNLTPLNYEMLPNKDEISHVKWLGKI